MLSWDEQAKAADEYLDGGKVRAYPSDDMIKVVNLIVEGKTFEQILQEVSELSNNQSNIGTITAYVTTAIQEGGKVKPLSKGGWYAKKKGSNKYTVAPGFVKAWCELRNLPLPKDFELA